MKIFLVTIFSLLTINTFAGISLDIDFQQKESGNLTKFKMKIETILDEVNTFQIPNSNKFVEVKVTDRIPEVFEIYGHHDDQVLIDLKILEKNKNNQKVLASPKIVTIYGKEGTLETFENENSKKPIMSLKIIPLKN